MRLNRLTLCGFKSFPERTRLAFPVGISAIVGPNGCGKSNVVDAVRWVLGEQSPSMLRARSMDEVLYSGDNGRLLNFAEVCLIVENNGSISHPDLQNTPEIEITRRLYRSGDSEYRLNGKVCRLKDIHYLFLDTGAGTRAYSIVDQGQIGAFVDMGPEERRHLLEEVAGISRYKARRGEAQRRMEQTKQNLERLGDLMAEIERQIRSLARQAKKTEKYLSLRQDQERLSRELLAHAWSGHAADKRDLKQKQESASLILAGHTARLSQQTAALEAAEIELLELEDAVGTSADGVAAGENHLTGLREELSQQEKLLIREENHLKAAESTLSDLDARRVTMERREGDLRGAIGALRKTESELLFKVERDEEALGNVKSIRDQVRNSLEAVKVQLVDAAAKCARLDGKRRGLRDRRDRLEQRIGQKGHEVSAASAKASRMENDRLVLEAAIAQCRSGLEDIAAGVACLQEVRSALRDRLETAVSRRRGIEAERTTCEAQRKALESVDASGEGYSPATRALLHSGIETIGVLADLLQVTPGWEQVVELALGPTVQAVVTRDDAARDKALELIREGPGGEAHIIVADDGVVAIETVQGTLLDHVRSSSSVRGVIAAILRRFRVTPDLETALTARREHGDDARFITPRGEILEPWGEIVVTGKGKAASSGILLRKAEIARLVARSSGLADLFLEAGRREKEIGAELSETDRQLEQVLLQRESLSKELAEKTRTLEGLAVGIDAQKERLAYVSLEIEQAREELLDVQSALEDLEEGLEAANRAKALAEAGIKGRDDALRQQEQVLARNRAALQGHKVELSRIQTQLEGQERELSGLEENKERTAADKAGALRKQEELARVLGERLGALKEVRLKVGVQEQAVSAARQRLGEMRKAHDGKRHILAGLQAGVKDLQATLRECEEQAHKNELALSGVCQSLEYLKKTCRERHQAAIEQCFGEWLPPLPFSPEETEEKISGIETRIQSLGPVNLAAVEEYKELDERRTYLKTQEADLLHSIEDLQQAINRMNRTCRERFKSAFDEVNRSLADVFPVLFEGASAELVLSGSDDLLDAGVEFLVHLPGKKIRHLNLLSGGEKAMAALALIFAIYFIKPSPFCLLDEVDASLDEANTTRFNRLIQKISEHSQVVLVTHNQRVMEVADTLYGITMEDKGVSKLVSVELAVR
jgi:chromosome segregation protein